MRVGSNLSGIDLVAQHNLLQASNQVNLSSVRLATMQRINSGSDDQAGLIAAENLRAELTAINAATDNAARAGAIVRTADSALSEVNNLLNTIRGNAVSAASSGRSEAELAALQMETDAALEAINRIGTSTSFAGEKPLDGGQMTVALSPDVSNVTTLSLPTISTSALGGSAGLLSDLASGGSASLADGDLATAVEILDAASGRVFEARARLGSFEKNAVESVTRVLDSMEENISAAFSQIFDTNVSEESSRLVRSQILAKTSISSVLLAGQSRNQIGNLLGEA